MVHWQSALVSVLTLVGTIAGVAVFLVVPEESSFWWLRNYHSGVKLEIISQGKVQPVKANDDDNGNVEPFIPPLNFPQVVLDKAYNAKRDFRNDKGIVPSYWDTTSTTTTNSTTRGPLRWGPCYAPAGNVDWDKQMERWHGVEDDDVFHDMQGAYHDMDAIKARDTDLHDYCRPGFVILGPGKCGTSSLYHYLVKHPRVLPATEKQIHYFIFHLGRKPMTWYYAHFPTATSFLANGALMTGEASPGYIYYPAVANFMQKVLKGTKFISLGRNPLERAWSAYKYVYVNTATECMQDGKFDHIPANQTKEFYQEYLFSFEDLILAEMKQLKECLAPDGPGPAMAKQMYGKLPWAKAEFERREREGLPPMVDIDAHCYGKKVSDKIPKKQFTDLVEKYPDKVLDTPWLFQTQAILGKSLYVFRMEWYKFLYSDDELYFLCTEEMSDKSGEPMNKLVEWLGLPRYDMAHIVDEGMYNVAGHEGYDIETSWEEIKEDQEEHKPSTSQSDEDIPLSEETRRQVLEFVKPYNERLFELIGKRCDW